MTNLQTRSTETTTALARDIAAGLRAVGYTRLSAITALRTLGYTFADASFAVDTVAPAASWQGQGLSDPSTMTDAARRVWAARVIAETADDDGNYRS
jgi:hypothetical protein